MHSVFEALSHPIRRAVLRRLGDGPQTAGALAAEFSVSKPTMSRHFAVLVDAGLIGRERRGNEILYSLNLSVTEEVLAAVLSLVNYERREMQQ